MIESTQVLHQLKVATNYSKLAMHKCGPRSFKSGQGAMCKVLYKFGDGKLSLKKLEERLGWDGHEVVRVAEKAQENGYVRFATSKKGKLSVALTDKGTMVVEKRRRGPRGRRGAGGPVRQGTRVPAETDRQGDR